MTQPAPTIYGPVYVSFSAEITVATAELLIAVMANQVTAGAREVHLLLSTSGGNVMHAVELYNVLRALPLELITHNVANVDSAGIIVLLAGARRYAVPQATFAFHGVNIVPLPGVALYERDLRERLAYIRGEQARVGAIYRERSRMTSKKVAEVFRTPRTIDATEAVRLGVVEMVREITIPVGSPLIGVVFPRQSV